MDDLDLTALAAKAYQMQDGIDLSWWHPLHDDGSSFRLACRLRIDVQWNHESGYVEAYLSTDIKHPVIRELFIGKVDKACRRVIVRAAAEIGKKIT